MATKPASEQPGKTVAAHDDAHAVAHPVDDPQDWGWHGEWGRASRVGGWISLVVLLLMMLPAHYNGQGILFLGITAALLFVALLWDRQRRKHFWRE